ncbi:hypothetical protein XELAEV_18015516mg [Xenopus laevis]|uniref:Uncharacterized protein n=1 Tax=Xenopus laevis TaxID=8355 RepID=A0A974HWG2_XENLA|nr:hypothetical protein XELAEV_18015516mg [Xenopus laevis]
MEVNKTQPSIPLGMEPLSLLRYWPSLLRSLSSSHYLSRTPSQVSLPDFPFSLYLGPLFDLPSPHMVSLCSCLPSFPPTLPVFA